MSRRGTLWQWLVALGCAAVIAALVHRTTEERVRREGRAAFSPLLWRVYDWQVWPLSLFR